MDKEQLPDLSLLRSLRLQSRLTRHPDVHMSRWEPRTWSEVHRESACSHRVCRKKSKDMFLVSLPVSLASPLTLLPLLSFVFQYRCSLLAFCCTCISSLSAHSWAMRFCMLLCVV